MDVRWLLLPLALAAGNLTAAAESPDPSAQADPREIFRLLDLDGDNLLTYEEVSAIPALTLVYERMDTDASGGLDYAEFSRTESAAAAPASGGPQRPDLAGLDTDADGRIDRDEARRHPPLYDQWARYDTDNSGYIEPGEFSAFEADTLDSPTPVGRVEFEQLDTNRDQLISQEEAASERRLVERWLELDEDESGSLDKAEFSQFQEITDAPPGDLSGEKDVQSSAPRDRGDDYRGRHRPQR